jgi:O-antigen ligase
MRTILNFEEIKQIEGFHENISWSIFSFDIVLFLLFIAVIATIFPLKKTTILKRINFQTFLENPLYLFIIWILTAIFFANDVQIAFYVTTRFLLAIVAFFLLQRVFNYRRRTFTYATFILFITGVLQAIIGISQFVLQKSIGLKILGESDISSTIAGVAKFEIAGSKIIRAYGTFPHPNLFAAFLLFALAAGFWLFLYTNFSRKSRFISNFVPSSLVVIILGIFLSYSRSVIFILIIFLTIIIFAHKEKYVTFFKQICTYLHIPSMLQGVFGIFLAFSLLFLSYNILSPRICINNCANDNSIDLRLKYLETACSSITSHPFLGVGMGNFVSSQKESSLKKLAPWEQQPVHNLYLLIASEIGLIGVVLFLYTIVNLTQIFNKGFFGKLHNPFFLCFFGFLILGFADHYFWTLPQGMLIFWVCLAFFHSSTKINKINKPTKKVTSNQS